MTRLLIVALVTAAIRTRAETSYQADTGKGPVTCYCSEKYNPSVPVYNLLQSPYIAKYRTPQEHSTFPANVPPSQQGLTDHEPFCAHTPATLTAERTLQLLGARPAFPGVPTFSGFVIPSILRQIRPPVTLDTPPPVIIPPSPPTPDPPSVDEVESTTSHIMKIPRKSESSITITFNTPDETSAQMSSSSSTFQNVVSSPNSNFPVAASLPFPQPTPLILPPRPLFYTQPGPLIASCPATVFYSATIPAFPLLPTPPTCPAHPPTITPSPPVTPASTTVTSSEYKPNNDKTIASFTSALPNPGTVNLTSNADAKDPLLTFKLLTAAASKSRNTLPSANLEDLNRDCSMPIPPNVL